ncbi:beta-glucuronidase [candidate division KSB1 bacterium]|nr:beta-glucuronidase [candidate division KSB1 bacterium]
MKTSLKFIIIIIIGLQVCLTASDLIINVDGRNTSSLNGQWEYIVDPYDNGYYNYQLVPHTREGYFANRVPENKWDRIEYSFTDAHTLQVPGDWNTQSDQLYLYEGSLWYKKNFNYELKQGKRLFVYFGAVNYLCNIYFNGIPIGNHVGGFTPFNFEITDLVKEKDNLLVLRVNNTRKREGIPTINTDWWNYGGLTRRVELIEMPKTFVQDYSIQLAKGSDNRISGWIQLNGPDQASQNVSIKITELGIEKQFKTDANGLAKIELEASTVLWEPQNPKLYNVIVESESGKVTDAIGFRTIESTEDEILLNGKPLFLRGICIHEEAPIRGGRANRLEDARTLLGWAKEMGCNFVRLAHYPHNEFMTRLADEMGILVWSEIPVYWTVEFDNPDSYANAENQLAENITRDKNRASIILWSVANETPVHETRNRFLKNLVDKARQLDPTRLITAASDKSSTDGYAYNISDPLCEYLDVIGVNEYVGWYDGLPEKCDKVTWTREYKKPVIISETGGGALFGLQGDALTRWSEEYQEDLYKRQIGMLEKVSFLRGTAPWILMDFRSPRRPLYGIQDGWNRKGLISNFGDKKKAFFIMQHWYDKIESEGF